MERLSIYFTRNHSSIEVQEVDGSRQASARSMPVAIANLHDDDKDLLKRFCQSMLECIDGNCKRLNEW